MTVLRRALLALLLSVPLAAQTVEGTRAGVRLEAPDTAAAAEVFRQPPITPRRAFLSSLLVPGMGQAALDRPYAGGVFILVEAVALAMVHRSAEDMRIARRFARDSVPLTYQTDPITGVVTRDADGNPIVTSWQGSRYSEGWVRARRLHLEDWLAVLAFNHLFAGADAFVAAQLWDLPEKLALRQTPLGPALMATWRFGRAPRR